MDIVVAARCLTLDTVISTSAYSLVEGARRRKIEGMVAPLVGLRPHTLAEKAYLLKCNHKKMHTVRK